MGRIVVKSKKKVTHESDSGTVKIGTRTTCQVTLRDPVAAEIHCEISFTPQGFMIEDKGSSTGTYVNGLRVEGTQTLGQGDEIVLGVTKLVASLGRDGDLPVLELDLQEDKFFQKAKMSTGDNPTWIPGDREAFKEAEINFGAFPALRVTGWSAVAIAVIVIIVLAVPKVRGLIMQPGPIHNLHAQEIEANNCSACHLSSGDDGRAGCAVCHAEELTGRHPFPGTVGFNVAKQACTRCHVEHLGTETVRKVIEGSGGARVRVRDPRFVPPNFREVHGCEECHSTAPVPEIDDARDYLAELERKRLKREGRAIEAGGETALASTKEPGRLEGFSHEAHVGGKSISCDKCHLASDTAGRDFAPVAFNTCMTCHHAEQNLAYTSAEVTPDADWVGEAFDIRIDSTVHSGGEANVPVSAGTSGDSNSGSGSVANVSGANGDEESKCHLCHTDAPNRRMNSFSKPVFLSSVTGQRLPTGDGSPELYFSIETRGHEGLTSAVDCSECHFKGTLASNARSDRQFFHGLHLSKLLVGSAGDLDDAEAREVSSTCAECHSGTMGSMAFGEEAFDNAACAQCHGSDSNGGGVPVVASAARVEEGTRFDFPHQIHVNSTKGPLAKGCFACHEFTSDGDDLLAAPTTRPDVSNCMECHTGHQYTKGGSCSTCHDPNYEEAPDAGILASRSFSHFESGHAAMLSDCNRCHEGVASAAQVSDIGMPATSDADCFQCHFERRFHWR